MNEDMELRIEIADGTDIPETFSEFRLPVGYRALSKLVMRDLNNNPRYNRFYKHTFEEIRKYLADPRQNEKNLRDAVSYIYGASPHFRRIVQYFAGLNDLSYVISPYKVDVDTVKLKAFRGQYQKTKNLLSNMNIKTEFAKVLTVCWREDVFYGTFVEASDSIALLQLPPEFCRITSIEGGVFNVTFDFSFFNSRQSDLRFYPPEFEERYNIYRSDSIGCRWQELNSPNSFAVKCNQDITEYALPPLAGILREIYDIEDYKSLKLTRTELENYAILVMKLGMTDDGEYTMEYQKAKDFWRNLDSVLPEEVGSILSPMQIEKIGFDRNGVGDADAVAEAEQRLFGAAGVSSLLFSNEKASANALLLSVKVDQSETYRVVKSIEQVINRFIQNKSYGKKFHVTFLDVSPFNRKEVGDSYLKACQYGIPLVSYYCASQGLSQIDMEGMSFIENNIMGIQERFAPLQSSATMSDSDGESGAPEKDAEELTDAGEITRESR